MVHTITKHVPFMTCDEGDFPLPDGPFAPKAKGQGKQKSWDMGSVSTAVSMVGQARQGGLSRHHDGQGVHGLTREAPYTGIQDGVWGTQEGNPCCRQRGVPPQVQ